MAKGVTEIVEDFKILHPRAYARIYNQAIEVYKNELIEHSLYTETEDGWIGMTIDIKKIEEIAKQIKK